MSASASADSFFVYILRCAEGSLYVGHASDVLARVKVHNEGRGALWTARRRPVNLVYAGMLLSPTRHITPLRRRQKPPTQA
jgi:predicted GIY-YIG superfamily endonuclease